MDKVEIDGLTADRIVLCSLKETMNYLRGDIKNLKRKKNLNDYQKQELADVIIQLDAMEKVYEYYGGKL